MKKLVTVFSVAMMLFVVGCKDNKNSIIDHVTFKLGEDMESANVALVFKPSVMTNLAGTFQLKDYGFIYVNPFIANQQPLELGFQLNTKDIMNDQDYVQIAPTETLPNGLPLGLGYPLVEVKGAEPIGENFDLFGYVDVLHAKWLGVAAMFKGMNDGFSAGLTVSQGFNPDAQGNPGMLVSIFGPTLGEQGQVIRNGGIILLANVRQLVGEGKFQPGEEYQYFPKKKFRKGGPGVLLK